MDSLNTTKRFDATKKVVDVLDAFIKPLVAYSVAMLLLECHLYPESNSTEHSFFLWSERVVASIFTIEYAFRFWRNSGREFYPTSAFGIIDLVAILPFWIGFFTFAQPYLQLIRTLRVFRMLKFFRYNRSLQLISLGFYRAWFGLRPLLFTTTMIIFFTMFALYEIEGPHQDEFRNLGNLFYFLVVTGTTVGYGDLSPVTGFGKLIVTGYMAAGLAIFMACFSAVTVAFDKVFEEESDPNIDPLLEFKKIRQERKEISLLSKLTGTTDDDDARRK